MFISVDDKENPAISALDFDDVANVELVVRVTGVREIKDEGGEVHKSYDLEATVTKVNRENVSRRGALERAMNKLDSDPYVQNRIVPG